MRLLELVRGRLVIPSLAAQEKRAAIEEILDFMVTEGALSPEQRPHVAAAVHGREDFMSTGMEQGIALPHGVTDKVADEMATLAISKKGIPFESYDQRPAQILILLLTPASVAITRVRTLAEIARVVSDQHVRKALIDAPTAEETLKVLRLATVRCEASKKP